MRTRVMRTRMQRILWANQVVFQHRTSGRVNNDGRPTNDETHFKPISVNAAPTTPMLPWHDPASERYALPAAIGAQTFPQCPSLEHWTGVQGRARSPWKLV